MNIIGANLVTIEDIKRRLKALDFHGLARQTHRELIELIESTLTGMSDVALEITGLMNIISARKAEVSKERDAHRD